ncbi:Asp_protease_2 domain-containing protein [Cucumis melo var. makuwa]|uniref:Asp_protease_2 domain-containing protein n=1 Tax=Cucumis melo var. makuwa TaxID=1194695 RepID=A0A5A7T8T3_CUCMM|nr:Asp_protease_2 domain-containing protein [Cucumis melo var. makuwa]
MLYLAEVPDSIHYLESRLEEISKKAGTIDAVTGHVEGLPIQKLLARIDTLETNTNVRRTVNYKHGYSSSSFAAHMEERVGELDSFQKTLLEMINGMQRIFELPSMWAETVAKTKLYEQRVQDLTLAYPAVERLFDLTSDSQDVRRDQSSSPRRNRNSRSSSPKDAEGGKDFGRDRRPYQSNTENTQRRPNNRSPPKRPLSCFTCEGPYLARECLNKVYRGQTSKTPLGEGFRKNESREYCCPTFRRASETTDDKVGRVERLRRLCGCKDGDFDIVLGIEFLLEHQVIPMPSPKCLVITGSLPTVVQADIRQPNRFKVISAIQLDESLVQEEPPSATILLGALRKLGETVLKDTLCVPEKYHG